MNENYTKGVQRILKYAKEEAIRLSNTYVGSEHLLLAVLKDDNGNAAKMLLSIGLIVSTSLPSGTPTNSRPK